MPSSQDTDTQRAPVPYKLQPQCHCGTASTITHTARRSGQNGPRHEVGAFTQSVISYKNTLPISRIRLYVLLYVIDWVYTIFLFDSDGVDTSSAPSYPPMHA